MFIFGNVGFLPQLLLFLSERRFIWPVNQWDPRHTESITRKARFDHVSAHWSLYWQTILNFNFGLVSSEATHYLAGVLFGVFLLVSPPPATRDPDGKEYKLPRTLKLQSHQNTLRMA